MHFIKDYINIIRLMLTKYFDKKYYKLENPDVKGNLYKHYYLFGYKEGRNPSRYFDNDYYLMKHKDVKDANINPLIHYLKKGKREKRKIKGFKGISVNRIYYKLYNEFYFINVHLTNEEKKVNFIINKLNNDTLKVINELNEKYCFDRLFYFDGDKEILKEFGKNIICEKICKDYYLNIGINDLNICFDKHSLMSFNNNIYVNNLYLYIDKIDSYDKEFINYISYYAKKGRIKILSSNNIKINEPLFFDVPSFDSNTICFVFKDNLFLGLELLNDYLLNNNFNNIKEIYYESNSFSYSIYLERDIILNYNKLDIMEGNKLVFDSEGIYLDNGIFLIKFKTNNYLKIYKIEKILDKNK